MIVGKRVFCVWYGEDCVSVPRGSGVRMLFAECDPFCPPLVSCCQQACVQASALRYWSIRCSMRVSMVSQRSPSCTSKSTCEVLRRNVVTLDISCLACPQSQLDGCSRDQFRRVSTCSAGNGSSCPVQVEFLHLRLWCPLPLARGDLLQGPSPRIVLFAKLSPGLMSLAIMTTNLFQFRFADTEQYWHSSCLISLTLFRTDNKHVRVWCAFACFGWGELTLTP